MTKTLERPEDAILGGIPRENVEMVIGLFGLFGWTLAHLLMAHEATRELPILLPAAFAGACGVVTVSVSLLRNATEKGWKISMLAAALAMPCMHSAMLWAMETSL